MFAMPDNVRAGMDVADKSRKTPTKLLGRKFLSGLTVASNVQVPALCKFVIIRCVGRGSAFISTATEMGTAPGAYSKKYLAVDPGRVMACTVDVASARVVINGTVVCRAGSGVDYLPGAASACIGDVIRVGTAPTNTSSTVIGGTAPNDLSDTDSLVIYGTGAQAKGGTLKEGQGYGYGGARTASVTFNPGPGLIAIEFYNRDPRGSIL